MSGTKDKVPPWKKPKPKVGRSTKLTAEEIERAKKRAKAAGRTYPNLIDNMWAAKKKREKGE